LCKFYNHTDYRYFNNYFWHFRLFNLDRVITIVFLVAKPFSYTSARP
jgi:hypothetical protein